MGNTMAHKQMKKTDDGDKGKQLMMKQCPNDMCMGGLELVKRPGQPFGIGELYCRKCGMVVPKKETIAEKVTDAKAKIEKFMLANNMSPMTLLFVVIVAALAAAGIYYWYSQRKQTTTFAQGGQKYSFSLDKQRMMGGAKRSRGGAKRSRGGAKRTRGGAKRTRGGAKRTRSLKTGSTIGGAN